jgi:hypothetical protein
LFGGLCVLHVLVRTLQPQPGRSCDESAVPRGPRSVSLHKYSFTCNCQDFYDLLDYDEMFYYEEEIVSGKPVDVKLELERRFDANVFLWAEDAPPNDGKSAGQRAYVDLHKIIGRKERVDQNHVKYILDLKLGQKRLVNYSVTYKRRKLPPEVNQQTRREPL